MQRQCGRRVVVTGLGLVTPLGCSEASFWQRLREGRTGIGPIRAFDTAEYRTPCGAEVDTDALAAEQKRWALRPIDRCVDMAMVSAAQALCGAGLLTPEGDPPPRAIATIFGTGAGAAPSVAAAFKGFAAKGVRGVRPSSVPKCMANAISSRISLRFRLTGTNYVITSACTSSTGAIGTAFRMVRDGYADCVLCGGAEAMFDPFHFAAWNNLGVMSRNDDPATACRPWDADRDGFVLGEGAAALVVENADAAAARGTRVRAELCGYGESSDATHIIRPDPQGQIRAMRAALADADMPASAIGFVNAHAPATQAGDAAEAEAIATVLGHARDHVPVGSNKSFFGHMLGAAGAVETAATILGLEHGVLPPNPNLVRPDPALPLRPVGRQAESCDAPVAMKNTFAFGGNNAALILKRWDD